MARAKSTSTGKNSLQVKRPSKAAPDTPTGAKLSPEEVYRLIQESAYFKAKERGFAPGGEVQDWIEAEAEVRRKLEDRAQ
ncbi:MAG TPA: DUF2934 domain-containing protein [Burkholderiales bacterium]|nr:DUF2934 domain-containing protein [Burkholderiales bacterium]